MIDPAIQTTHAKSPANTTIRRRMILMHAIAFVVGFSTIFIVGWGGAATLLGGVFRTYKTELAQIGGLVVIVFGLVTLGILRIPLFYYDTRPHWGINHRSGILSSSLMGVVFAAGWTPCIGTTLGAILTLGVSQETTGQAMWLASGYALGLGSPFIALGFGVDRFMSWLVRFRKHMRKVRIASGVLLIGIGILLLTNQMTLIAIWAQQNGLYLDVPFGGVGVPTYFIALIAGLVSFLSPCVLPLVPAYIGYLSGHAVREQR